MNALASPFRQLMERKLWPLAILLVAALAAVPMLLAKDEAPVPAAPAGTATAAAPAAQAPTQPIVTLGQPADREASRKVLGARKNPFEPARKAKKPTAARTSTQAPVPTVGGAKPGSGGKTPSPPSVGGTPSTPSVTPPATVSPTAPAPAATLYDLYAAKIRFGRSSDDSLKTRMPLKRLTALPRVEDPKVVFLGLKRDLKTAVFLLAADTRVVGEGACLPSREDCQTVELKAGESEFVSVVDSSGATTAQYQLDMVKVVRGVTMDPKVARRWRHTIARDGREALRANLNRVNHWKYDTKKGVVYRAIAG